MSMRVKFIPLIVALAAGVLALTLVTSGQAGSGNIFGSGHDLGSAGNPTCAQCHLPHNAQGSYLWANVPSGALPGLGSLCFSCHDGSVTPKGQFIADPLYESHEVTPDVYGSDCDRCHDPHEGGNWEFVKNSIAVGYRNANICSACHGTGTFSHPVDELTNLPVDRTWDPYAGTPDHSGTRLWNEAGTAEVASGDGNIKCATCHVVHGATPSVGVVPDPLNAMPYSESGSSHSPICENCHQ